MASQKEYIEQVAQQFIDAIEKGTAPWMKGWEAGASQLPLNATTGKPYKGINQLRLGMVMNEKGGDPRFATYKQCVDQGWQVKQGEHGIPIQFFSVQRKETALDENNQPIVDKEGNRDLVDIKPRSILKTYTVFHASQIEGIPALELPNITPDELFKRHERTEKLLKDSGAKIKHDQVDRCYYASASDEIHLVKRQQFKNEEQYYGTALHELSHWTGHESRLNRDLAYAAKGDETYAREELRAEIASSMLETSLGISRSGMQEGHEAYVGSWIEVLKKDPREIFRAAADAAKIQEYVMGMEKEKPLNQDQEQSQEQPQEKEAEQASAPEKAPKREAPEPLPEGPAKEDTRLYVHFDVKDEAKALGAKWDKNEKTWYAPAGTDLTPLQKYLKPQEKKAEQASAPEKAPKRDAPDPLPEGPAKEDTRLYVHFDVKDEAKALGAKWDKNEKTWYAPAGTDLKPLQEYLKPQERKQEKLGPVAEFGVHLKKAGLVLDGPPVADGKEHKVPVVSDTNGKQSGRYSLQQDEQAPNGYSGNFSNYREGQLNTQWQATGLMMSDAERNQQSAANEQVKENLRQHEASKVQEQPQEQVQEESQDFER